MAASSPPPAPAAAGQEPEPVARLNTRVRALDLRSGGGAGGAAPAHGGAARTYPPMCQVDHCGADLTGAKAYHRRHRICVAHMRAAETPVAGMTQRFCQMCSRFHPLAEFDGHRRSCRRRLAHARFIEQRRFRLAGAAPQDDVNLIPVTAPLQGHMKTAQPMEVCAAWYGTRWSLASQAGPTSAAARCIPEAPGGSLEPFCTYNPTADVNSAMKSC